MLRGVIYPIGLVITPILLVIAWRDWLRSDRAALPPWRNGIGLAALLIASLSWAMAGFVEISVLLRYKIPGLTGLTLIFLWQQLVISAVVLGFALKGAPRVLAVMAGLLMLISWPIIYT